MAGSSELMTSGWSSNINAAAGWFRRSFTSFITYRNEEIEKNTRLQGSFPWQCNLLLGQCTWLEMGHTSTATRLFLDKSLVRGCRGKANPWPIRDVFNNRASNMFWSTSVPSRSSQQTHTNQKAPLCPVFGAGCPLKLSTSGNSKLTSFPSVEIERKGHPFLCWQGKGFSEVPQGSADIFTAHLYAKKQVITPNRRSH